MESVSKNLESVSKNLALKKLHNSDYEKGAIKVYLNTLGKHNFSIQKYDASLVMERRRGGGGGGGD